ncbi:MAG: hypothetical protein LBU51_07470, partial [Bacteroidales bacterium]|nr:hypothetical protein [Bacteroidales bacterium]
MMRKILFLLKINVGFFIVFQILLISCIKPPERCQEYFLDNVFELKVNECANIKFSNGNDTAISLHFKQVLDDSRCYKSDCFRCYGSKATILTSITYNDTVTHFIVPISGCMDIGSNVFDYKDT